MTHRLLRLALLGVLFAYGCSETHGGDDDAGGIVFPPEFADAGSDAGPVPTSIGDACMDDSMCGENEGCFTEWPGGYCLSDCSTGEACPDGTFCIQADRSTSVCLAGCDPSAGGDQCRPGYGCAGEGTEGVCAPGCEEDADCDAGLTCYPNAGGGSCRTAGADIGIACESSQMCGEGQRCIDERFGFPGGTCGELFVDCDPDTDTGCSVGTACLEFTARFRFTACVDGCSTSSDCSRADYDCLHRLAGRSSYCGPAFDPANLGQICSAGRGDCGGGVCLSETETGWPDSYCVSVGCTPGGGECPAGGVCGTFQGEQVCLDACASSVDCRNGYRCEPANPSDATSMLACRPGCGGDSDCGNETFVCNPGTGRCTLPFQPSNLGEPCQTEEEDCPGGVCLSEPAEGWPAGMCLLSGCDLSGGVTGVPCPAGSICTDDGIPPSQVGRCVPSCVGNSDCRPGYACSGGTCTPACTPSDCGPTRTCDASGRCV